MKQSFLLVIGIIVAIIIVIMVFVMPMYDDVKLTKSHMEEKIIMISELRDLITKIDDWRVLLAEKESVINEVGLSLPEDKDLPNLIVALESMSSSSGIALDSVKLQGEESGGRRSLTVDQVNRKNVSSVNLSVELIGSYSAFKSFIGKLENNIRSFDVKSISFSESESQIGSDSFKFIISGLVYYK